MARQFGSSFTLIDTGTQGVLGSGREEYRMPTVYARTLRRAAELLGGEGALAARLGVTKKELDLWLRISAILIYFLAKLSCMHG